MAAQRPCARSYLRAARPASCCAWLWAKISAARRSISLAKVWKRSLSGLERALLVLERIELLERLQKRSDATRSRLRFPRTPRLSAPPHRSSARLARRGLPHGETEPVDLRPVRPSASISRAARRGLGAPHSRFRRWSWSSRLRAVPGQGGGPAPASARATSSPGIRRVRATRARPAFSPRSTRGSPRSMPEQRPARAGADVAGRRQRPADHLRAAPGSDVQRRHADRRPGRRRQLAPTDRSPAIHRRCRACSRTSREPPTTRRARSAQTRSACMPTATGSWSICAGRRRISWP